MWVATSVTGCRESPPVGPPVSEVIQGASVISFTELSEEEKAGLKNTYTDESFSFSSTGGWMSMDMETMPIQDAHFIRAQIDATALAYWTFLYDCGTLSAARVCSEKELAEKTQLALTLSEPNRLYGKYMNSWRFFDGETDLPMARKFTGYGTVDLQRVREGNKVLDQVVIGPIPGQPTKMTIQLANNLDGEGRTLGSPSTDISQ